MAASGPSPGGWQLVALGSSLAGCVITGIGLGLLVDRFAGTSPLFLLVGLGLGVAAACFLAYSRVRSYLS